MKKMILPFLAAVVVMCAIFTGCGDKDNGGSTKNNSGTSDRNTSSSTSSTTSSTTYNTVPSTSANAMTSESMFDVQNGIVTDATDNR